jgi:hypothetical protein
VCSSDLALGVSKTAKGALYMDDEDTFGYGKRHEYANSTFTADWRGTDATLVNSVTIGSGWQEFSDKLASDRMVERIIIMGVETHPKSIQLHGGNALEFTYSPHTNSVVIRKPELSAMAEWTIYITSS